MKMRPLPGIDIESKGQAVPKPGGLHVMLIDLEAAIRERDVVPTTLSVDDGSSKQVDAKVLRPMAAPMPAAMEHKHRVRFWPLCSGPPWQSQGSPVTQRVALWRARCRARGFTSPCPVPIADGVEKGLEPGQATEHFLVAGPAEFRVPLQAGQEIAAAAAYGLDHAVAGRPCLKHRIAAKAADALVVDRNHRALHGAPQKSFQEAARFERDLVGVPVAGLGDMDDRLRNLRGDVLVQRGAHGDVDQLGAATDTEHRFANREELMEQFHFIHASGLVA